MNHSPAFQFYAADFLSDENVVAMSLPARGAYITLICFCWREGSIPSDVNRLARLCGVDSSAMALLWQEVCLCFTESIADASRLIHPRLEKEREKQIAHRKERSETGRHGAEQRWGKTQPQPEQEDKATKKGKPKGNSSAIAQPMAKPMAKHGSSSSSSPSGKDSGTNVPDAGAPDEPEPSTSEPPTPEYKQFKREFSQAYIATLAEISPDAPRYVATVADWVQVAALWRRSRTGGKDGGPWEFTPDRVARALANYRASPIGIRTLADFASKFSTFFSHPLDQFKGPGGKPNGTHPNQPNTPAQQQRATQVGKFGRDARRLSGQSSDSES